MQTVIVMKPGPVCWKATAVHNVLLRSSGQVVLPDSTDEKTPNQSLQPAQRTSYYNY